MSTLLIKKGNVYDGTGLEPVTADIYAEDGFIREVGPDIKKQADMEIEIGRAHV